MKVSIIIPVYNLEDYLRECIESILKQSYDNIELLLVNDESPDRSEAICKEYERQHSFIRVINKKNGGPADTKNVGIEHATGDYIMFIDGDDYWEIDFLGKLMDYLKRNPRMEYVFFRYQFYYQQRNFKREQRYDIKEEGVAKRTGAECLDYILSHTKQFQWFPWLGIIKKDFLLKHELFFTKGIKYDDILWTPHVFLRAKHVGYFDEAVYTYRLERPGQVTSIFSGPVMEENIYIAVYWYHMLQKYPMTETLKNKLSDSFTYRYYFAIWFGGFLPRKEKQKVTALLQEHRYLLAYRNDSIKKLTCFCSKTLGFSAAMTIFKQAVMIKRKLEGKQTA